MTFARSAAVAAVAAFPTMVVGPAAHAQDQTAFDLFQAFSGTMLAGILAYDSADENGTDGFTVQGVQLTPPAPDAPTILIDSVSVQNFDTASVLAGSGPTRMIVEFNGIDVSLEGVPDADAFSELGISRLLGDVALDYALDPATQILQINGLSVDFKGLGALELSAAVGGIAQEAFLNPQMAAFSASLNSLTATYTDDSFVQRIMTLGASEEGKTEEQFLQDSLAELDALQAEAGASGGVLDPLSAFLRDYQSPAPLTATFSPAAPVPVLSLMALQSPADWISTLGMDLNYGG